MLIGYVSDERYVALPDVLVEIEVEGRSFETRSRATGAIYADLNSGLAKVTLYKPGFGQKQVDVDIGAPIPHSFRLLRDNLLAYLWPKWVKAGEQAEFRVHSVEEYKLDLFRYGARKEFVQPVGWFDEHGPLATMQVTPDGDYSQSGVRWNEVGYTNPHHHQYIEAPERSGLYYLHARTPSGGFFAAPWIVAPAKPQQRIAVLASNITWNAYNNFGGRSNYACPKGLPATPIINARQSLPRYVDPKHIHYDSETYPPLSFDRPEPINHIPETAQLRDPIEGRAPNHIAPAEWRLLGWLEENHFGYDYYAETQLHAGELDLDAYEVLILSTHPEYWSEEMYFAVKSWVHERGGKLLYLGGNGINAAVEFHGMESMTIHNCDERQWSQDVSIESRFHAYTGESEAKLLGVVWDDRGIMTASPYRVCDASHWAFAGTGLKDGDTFGQASLHERVPGGASGHETDKVSPSSPENLKRLAMGLNANEGGADMVTYDTPSGGSVFSVASITWVSSLLVDAQVSTITANVLRRFLS